MVCFRLNSSKRMFKKINDQLVLVIVIRSRSRSRSKNKIKLKTDCFWINLCSHLICWRLYAYVCSLDSYLSFWQLYLPLPWNQMVLVLFQCFAWMFRIDKKIGIFLLPHSAWAKAVAMSLHNNSTAAAAAVAVWLTHRAHTIWASKVRVHVAFFYSLHDRALAATVVVSVEPNTEHCMDWPTSCSRKFASNSRISN